MHTPQIHSCSFSVLLPAPLWDWNVEGSCPLQPPSLRKPGHSRGAAVVCGHCIAAWAPSREGGWGQRVKYFLQLLLWSGVWKTATFQCSALSTRFLEGSLPFHESRPHLLSNFAYLIKIKRTNLKGQIPITRKETKISKNTALMYVFSTLPYCVSVHTSHVFVWRCAHTFLPFQWQAPLSSGQGHALSHGWD